jgi:hypothetical protein
VNLRKLNEKGNFEGVIVAYGTQKQVSAGISRMIN